MYGVKKPEDFFFFFVLFTFRKPLKLFWGLPKWKFLPEKAKITPGKKSGKVTLPLLQKNFPVKPLLLLILFPALFYPSAVIECEYYFCVS